MCFHMCLKEDGFIHKIYIYTECPNKGARFNFVINAPFIQKVLIFLFQYKVHILQLTVEHSILQISPTTQQSCGAQQCAHFKSCALVGTLHIYIFIHIIQINVDKNKQNHIKLVGIISE